MALPLLTALLWGTVPLQTPPLPPAQARPQAVAPARAPESDASRILRLRARVEAAEKALEAENLGTAVARADDADILTADWSPGLLGQPEVQALLQRLKDVQDQLAGEGPEEAEPGLKEPLEVLSISGHELRAELERVRQAEHGVTYDFPIDLNDKVLTWVSLFTTTKRGFMENALGRASMYMPMIRQIFAEEGVPQDLAYLAVIESGFRNEAKSRAKAVGMWQFIRSTGRIYGLTGSAWLEERRDPVKATRAAARYLKRLYEISGDWYLAASGYNAGPLTLERAIQNIGTRNFWDLARSRWLRTETKNYVPELCAAILVGRNPELYGLRIQALPPYAFETVQVPSMTSLSVLARSAGTDTATLKELNPELLRGSTPPGSYALRVPPGHAGDLLRQLAHLPAGRRPEFKSYTVRKGETLAQVARRFKLSPEDLLEANDLTARQFKAGRRLQVPPPPALALDDRDLAPRGERVKRLGDQPLEPLPALPGAAVPVPLGVTLADGKPASTGDSAPVEAAQTAPPPTSTVPPPPPSSAPAPRPPGPAPELAPTTLPGGDGPTLIARPGDTLARIARSRGVSLGTLIRLNPDAVKALHPGDTVRLPEAAGSAASSRQATSHQVRRGDTLAAIARDYGVGVADLRSWNRLKGDRIQVGQRLRLTPR